MGAAARQGRGMSAPDGMIAAIARVNGGRWPLAIGLTSRQRASNSHLRGIFEAAEGLKSLLVFGSLTRNWSRPLLAGQHLAAIPGNPYFTE